MDVLTILDKISWQGAGTTFAQWEQKGIKHGFMGVGPEPHFVHYPKQVHGTAVVYATDDTKHSSSGNRSEADAIFTATRGECVAVRTADCLPLLVYSDAGVLAIHAGWRGLVAGMVSHALRFFEEQGADLATSLVGLGPCICAGRFEVGPEVAAAFKNHPAGFSSEQIVHCLSKGRDDRWHLDLAVAAVFEMIKVGISAQNISVMRSCTFNDDGWHSYRAQGAAAGRNWSWIGY